MWCIRCNQELGLCQCADLEERLRALQNSPHVHHSITDKIADNLKKRMLPLPPIQLSPDLCVELDSNGRMTFCTVDDMGKLEEVLCLSGEEGDRLREVLKRGEATKSKG